ncbi:hypothetical protein DICPUDRAFT_155734 [Dictyostelium purpureum]|uniref:Uncharacterized protein n=1 Tax=Dictyostelium purpureum TaxID=5786 RepID=F0ZUR3_DICPU|nr:uncharacterized protein DICPUDRAFT_155734 [Dictyostelium purpureum]EGC32320.1 hypothetical protein DICPUDRAFT_155734 [Dictyostelium purpureum]|eukprot:XP_003291162.1 hypothetical protein DICPUDRAFT_155734 [Dictyostelium purpureum]
MSQRLVSINIADILKIHQLQSTKMINRGFLRNSCNSVPIIPNQSSIVNDTIAELECAISDASSFK